MKPFKSAGQYIRRNRRYKPYRQLACAGAEVFRNARLYVSGFPEYEPRPRQERPSGFREHGGSSEPLEKLLTELMFEFYYLLAERGLSHKAYPGSLAETACLGDRDKISKLMKFHERPSTYWDISIIDDNYTYYSQLIFDVYRK
jgi:hypothetical protein